MKTTSFKTGKYNYDGLISQVTVSINTEANSQEATVNCTLYVIIAAAKERQTDFTVRIRNNKSVITFDFQDPIGDFGGDARVYTQTFSKKMLIANVAQENIQVLIKQSDTSYGGHLFNESTHQLALYYESLSNPTLKTPYSFTVSDSSEKTFSWTASTDKINNKVRGYRVRWFINRTGNGEGYTDITGTSISIFNPNADSVKYIGIQALGTTEDASFPMFIGNIQRITTGISAPTNFTMNKKRYSPGDAIKMTWDASQVYGAISGSPTYVIYRSENDGTARNIGSTNFTYFNTYFNKTIAQQENCKHTYYIVAIFGSYTSQPSNSIEAYLTRKFSLGKQTKENIQISGNSIAIAPIPLIKNQTEEILPLVTSNIVPITNLKISSGSKTTTTTSVWFRTSSWFLITSRNDGNGHYVDSTRNEQALLNVVGSALSTNTEVNEIIGEAYDANNINSALFAVSTSAKGSGFIYQQYLKNIQSEAIPFGDNKTIIDLFNGYKIIIKKLPFSIGGLYPIYDEWNGYTSIDSSLSSMARNGYGWQSIDCGSFFDNNSQEEFETTPSVFFTVQHFGDPAALTTDDKDRNAYTATVRQVINTSNTSFGVVKLGAFANYKNSLTTVKYRRDYNDNNYSLTKMYGENTLSGVLVAVAIGKVVNKEGS